MQMGEEDTQQPRGDTWRTQGESWGHLGTVRDTDHEVLLGTQLGLQLRSEHRNLPVVAAVALGTTRRVIWMCHPITGTPPGTTKPPTGVPWVTPTHGWPQEGGQSMGSSRKRLPTGAQQSMPTPLRCPSMGVLKQMPNPRRGQPWVSHGQCPP